MTATTKFNIGQTIFFMEGETPVKDRITGASFFTGTEKRATGEHYFTNEGETRVVYHTELCRTINEINAYASKEELIKAKFDAL